MDNWRPPALQHSALKFGQRRTFCFPRFDKKEKNKNTPIFWEFLRRLFLEVKNSWFLLNFENVILDFENEFFVDCAACASGSEQPMLLANCLGQVSMELVGGLLCLATKVVDWPSEGLVSLIGTGVNFGHDVMMLNIVLLPRVALLSASVVIGSFQRTSMGKVSFTSGQPRQGAITIGMCQGDNNTIAIDLPANRWQQHGQRWQQHKCATVVPTDSTFVKVVVWKLTWWRGMPWTKAASCSMLNVAQSKISEAMLCGLCSGKCMVQVVIAFVCLSLWLLLLINMPRALSVGLSLSFVPASNLVTTIMVHGSGGMRGKLKHPKQQFSHFGKRVWNETRSQNLTWTVLSVDGLLPSSFALRGDLVFATNCIGSFCETARDCHEDPLLPWLQCCWVWHLCCWTVTHMPVWRRRRTVEPLTLLKNPFICRFGLCCFDQCRSNLHLGCGQKSSVARKELIARLPMEQLPAMPLEIVGPALNVGISVMIPTTTFAVSTSRCARQMNPARIAPSECGVASCLAFTDEDLELEWCARFESVFCMTRNTSRVPDLRVCSALPWPEPCSNLNAFLWPQHMRMGRLLAGSGSSRGASTWHVEVEEASLSRTGLIGCHLWWRVRNKSLKLRVISETLSWRCSLLSQKISKRKTIKITSWKWTCVMPFLLIN